ncbi:uroporphyrin-III C-methyltransferase/precorrin-2 dehydrogenase/sirohydrochlorin ferrochelatase [Sphingobium sp. OAS761]|uniref:precorrin-2 dehydrogenase/sirohydrochlorin ferrochelatase family protein n=1 Tax=Sphingobium sp. OAS761 TaxID=2817901 RepID=UPI00209E95B7|nr:NAD(P)-dependent oxidoreductase [Sphingobium sp. OAS761]MCP1468414.1 uroporphyrin-III C-methyltransferase/precorrin-2 dehydrogenase/sirohydrochlorin ferrochelatase [Sphingobium sp. OAS761]
MHSLPVFLRLEGRAVIVTGQGEAAEAKRRLLERAGARVVGEADGDARIAIVSDGDADVAARLRARGVLVNATDNPDLCDFTLPAIVDRDPVLVAIGTGGASAGLAAALRQRLEALLPVHLGDLARALFAARAELRRLWPDAGTRRRALARALAPGGAIDPLGFDPDVDFWLADSPDAPVSELHVLHLRSADPDDLTLRDARMLAQADRLYHRPDVPDAILDRARADAVRIIADALPEARVEGVSLWLTLGGADDLPD